MIEGVSVVVAWVVLGVNVLLVAGIVFLAVKMARKG